MNYADCHADTLTRILEPEDLGHNSCNLDLERVSRFAQDYIQIFALWRDRAQMAGERLEDEFMDMYGRAAALLKQQEDRLCWCRSAEDLRSAQKNGRAAAFLAIEDISLMGDAAERIRELGFCFAMLAWNYENEYACGAAFDQAKGLSARGRELAAQLLEQGIVLDISHLSDQGAEDLFELTDRPLIASHSNLRSVCGHPRNLRPEHLRELICRNGLVGLNFYEDFVGADGGLTRLLLHVDAILEAGGEHVLALGSDFDGCGDRFAAGIRGAESMPGLYEAMARAGMDTAILDRIFYDNALDFLLNNL